MDTKRAPLLSLIFPTYNVEAYIAECLDSIFIKNPEALSFIECIVVDDGSPDKSAAISEGYKKRFERNCKGFNIIHQKNSGLSSARNTGIMAAKGWYCVFIDPDDMLGEGVLLPLKDLIEKENYPDFIVNKFSSLSNGVITSNRADFSSLQGLPPPALLTGLVNSYAFAFGAPFVTCKTALLKDGLLFDEKIFYGEDGEWWPKLVLRAKTCAVNDYKKDFYIYRKGRPGSLVNFLKLKKIDGLLDILDLQLEEAKDTRYSTHYFKQIYDNVSNFYKFYKKDPTYPAFIKRLKSRVYLLKDTPSDYEKKIYHDICFYGMKGSFVARSLRKNIRMRLTQTFLWKAIRRVLRACHLHK